MKLFRETLDAECILCIYSRLCEKGNPKLFDSCLVDYTSSLSEEYLTESTLTLIYFALFI